MNEQVYIETERLLLRQWKPADTEVYISINADKEVMEFFPSVLTAEQSLEQIERITKHIDEQGYGLFAVERKDNGAFIGFTGLSHPRFTEWFTPCTEIGWRIDKAHWNKGFATEAAKASLRFGFEKLQLKEIYSWTSVHNIRSEQVMKKTGMQKVGEFDHPLVEDGNYLKEHVLYKITNA